MKVAEKYPRNAIQEAWGYLEEVVNYALITHGLDDASDTNIQTNVLQLFRHGDVTMPEMQLVMNRFHQHWAYAKNSPQFTQTPEAVRETIKGMLEFSKKLVEKCDGVWTIRNETRGQKERK